MKIFSFIIISLLFLSCSFDKKSGIWKNEKIVILDKNTPFKDFKSISTKITTFEKEIKLNKDINIQITKPIINNHWKDIYYKKNNGTDNFAFEDLYSLTLKSKKLTRNKVADNVLFESDNLILSDNNGNIIVYSLGQRKIINKFNFYKKKYKNFKKKINLLVENNIIYASDNLGYLYAFDYVKTKVLWAKNYKIPFRSNLKLNIDTLFAANQNNNIYFFDKKNGNVLKMFPTEESIIKNKFINNLALDKGTLFFINTFGSLYSIDIKTSNINWFINISKNFDLNTSDLFNGSAITLKNDILLITSNNSFYMINSSNGSFIKKYNFSIKSEPIVNNSLIFLVTKQNILLAINILDGNILYSYKIEKQIEKILNKKIPKIEIKSILLINNFLNIFLENSQIHKFKIDGNFSEIIKLPSKIETRPIIVKKSLIYLNKRNQLILLN